ncbi:MAG: sugar-binding protein [Prolixibacteraceae bacterium]|nr:sugar-binding protein [Prolixibacteraceae bacterium]
MRKMRTRGLCWLLVLIYLLTVSAGCTSTPKTTEPAADTTTPSPEQSEVSADTESSASTGKTISEIISEPTPDTISETTPENTPEIKPTTPTTSIPTDHYVHSADKSFQNMTFTYAKLPAAITINDQYGYQSLGTMQLEEYPIDGVYDQAFNCIKVGDTYKMWWGRACPYDTIWYAESKDMKNWYNAQCVIDLKGYRTTWIKEMLLWSSVLYVDGQYHMFFETPASFDDQGEYNNNICYATSKDGIKWTFYPDNEDPQPVIKNPAVSRSYGVGQPKAFYMDGAFYIVYTDASDGGGRIRVAKSVGDPFHFGEVSTHPVIMSGIAGASVRYNETTEKYYMLVSSDVITGSGNSMGVYIQESGDLYKWPYSSVSRLKIKGGVLVSPEEITKKANPDFVTNDKGIVTDDTMTFMYMDGVMPSLSEDHRNTHTTWDGCLGVVTVENAYGKTATLPNGKTATAQNLVWYQDLVAQWIRPSVTAGKGTPVVDGIKDGLYGSSNTLIETVTWAGENSKPTATTGVASLAWDENALYMYIDVRDATPKRNDNIGKNDSVTLFVDAQVADTGEITADSYWLTVDAAGHYQAVNGKSEHITDTLKSLAVRVKTSSGGYIVEIKLPWYGVVKSQVKKGISIGVDICITDNIGMERNARVFWSDYAGSTEKLLNRYGQLTLK